MTGAVPAEQLAAPDLAYTAASLALYDARADIGDGTVVTALRPAIAAGLAVTAAAPHIRRHTLEQLAAGQTGNRVGRWCLLAALAGSLVLPSVAFYAATFGLWWLAAACAASWAGVVGGAVGAVRADYRAHAATVAALEAYDAPPVTARG